jgi:hypothetical protein
VTTRPAKTLVEESRRAAARSDLHACRFQRLALLGQAVGRSQASQAAVFVAVTEVTAGKLGEHATSEEQTADQPTSAYGFSAVAKKSTLLLITWVTTGPSERRVAAPNIQPNNRNPHSVCQGSSHPCLGRLHAVLHAYLPDGESRDPAAVCPRTQ